MVQLLKSLCDQSETNVMIVKKHHMGITSRRSSVDSGKDDKLMCSADVIGKNGKNGKNEKSGVYAAVCDVRGGRVVHRRQVATRQTIAKRLGRAELSTDDSLNLLWEPVK